MKNNLHDDQKVIFHLFVKVLPMKMAKQNDEDILRKTVV